MSETICGKTHPNLPKVYCGRHATSPGNHAGPCAKQVTLEWEYTVDGGLKRSAVVNGRVDNLELKHDGPRLVANEPTPVTDLTRMHEDDHGTD